MDDAASRDLEAKAGVRLIELGIPENGGLKWRTEPDFARLRQSSTISSSSVRESVFLPACFQSECSACPSR